MYAITRSLLVTLLCLLAACRHPLSIVGEGDIIELSQGVRGCTLEQFRAQHVACVDNRAGEGAYRVTYRAEPRPGWVFSGWGGSPCQWISAQGDCRYDLDRTTIDHARAILKGTAAQTLEAHFKPAADSTAETAALRSSAVGTIGFEGPHVTPLLVAGNHVYVTNTPAHTIDVLDRGSGKLQARIPVGIEPVSLAQRPDSGELWVANHVSDSVSIININTTSPRFLQVIDTIQALDHQGHTDFDEPVGIAFANADKAYIVLSSSNRIAVVDTRTRRLTRYIAIPAQDPRAAVVAGNRLFVAAFESHNRSQLSGCDAAHMDGDTCTFDAHAEVIENDNVLSQGYAADIVTNGALPDRDLFVFDTATDRQVQTVEGVGTLLYGMATAPDGSLFIAQTDARNTVNGRAGSAGHRLADLDNRPYRNVVTRLSCDERCGTPQHIDLEAEVAGGAGGFATALATPYAQIGRAHV